LIGPRLKGAVTLMAFTDSGWMRRFRVPRLAVTFVAFLLLTLTAATILSVAFAVWAGADLRRLTAVERENRSLSVQLQEQAGQLTRLKAEMSRLRELERNLRAVSGLTSQQAEAGEPTGKGGGLPPAFPR
jgi:hypothetical protein